MNIFKLAELQLMRERQDHRNLDLLLTRAIKIRKWIDHNKKTADHIINGGKVCFRSDGRFAIIK
jgi:hypothetical protein